jgi:uncharacterized membrane protein (UPF0127 family)
MATRALTLLLLLVLGACGDGGGGAAGEPSPETSFPIATALLDNGEESTLLTVEVAETPEQHERGLMGRESLPDDRGMVFVFFEERETGFWMKDTSIPLSIAYFDADGTIVRILDMEPCEKDPCPVYDPGVPYMGALEVNQGSFAEWDISEGDSIRLTR